MTNTIYARKKVKVNTLSIFPVVLNIFECKKVFKNKQEIVSYGQKGRKKNK